MVSNCFCPQRLLLIVDMFKNRVGGIALIEGVHSIDSYSDLSFQKWWSLVCLAFSFVSHHNLFVA